MTTEVELVASFFWRRRNTPGHDHCRLLRSRGGWRLSGMAVFLHGRQPCRLGYEVAADAGFRSRRAAVTGFIGKREVAEELRAAGRQWKHNGRPVAAVDGCVDIDLGFTPATNLLVLRRLALAIGDDEVGAPAAYLGFPSMRLTRLPQFYRRTTRDTYAYRSPDHGYAGTLHVTRHGAVIDYPELFVLEAGR
jgi:hypothetical protein